VYGYHLAILRSFPDTLAGAYLLRALQSQGVAAQLHAGANGVTRFGLSHDAIKSVQTPVPPLPEQIAIVRFLDWADRRIRRLIRPRQRRIKLLEEYKQALIHRAATGQIDVRTGRPYPAYKLSGVEWLGEMPEHWEVRRVKALFRLRIEKSGTNHGKELLSIYAHIGVRPRKDLEEKGNKASSTDDYWIVRKGDLISNKLLAWMGAIGVSHFDGVTSPAYDILMPAVDLSSDYYHHLFRTKHCLQEFKQRSRGIMEMRLRLYFDQFGQIRVPVPPVGEQKAIVRFFWKASATADQAIAADRREIELLKEFRTRLIADVVTGKFDTREVAAKLPVEPPEDVAEPLDERETTDGEQGIGEEDFEAVSEEAVR
jgi:type I restriction enzyme S subunit